MKTEEVQPLFSARFDVFDPILGQPTEAELTRLHEDITTILLLLLCDAKKGIQKLRGLVMDEDGYKVCYCSKFPTSTKPDVYNRNIPNNATDVVRSKVEAVHTAKIADYQIFAAAKHETLYFILAFVEDTWVHKLREPVTLYTVV